MPAVISSAACPLEIYSAAPELAAVDLAVSMRPKVGFYSRWDFLLIEVLKGSDDLSSLWLSFIFASVSLSVSTAGPLPFAFAFASDELSPVSLPDSFEAKLSGLVALVEILVDIACEPVGDTRTSFG